MELNAAGNVNFDFGRYGVEFVASPRHADGIVITGPVSENMATALSICYDAVPEPKIIILVGTDAISGGIFIDSPALNRNFIDEHHIDLYVPGNPAHPLVLFQYATGISAANTLAQRMRERRQAGARKYLAFLKAGASLYPINTLKVAGVDMTTPAPVEAAYTVLAGLVERLEGLVGGHPA